MLWVRARLSSSARLSCSSRTALTLCAMSAGWAECWWPAVKSAFFLADVRAYSSSVSRARALAGE